MKQLKLLFAVIAISCLFSCGDDDKDEPGTGLHDVKIEITNTGGYTGYVEGISFQVYSDKDVTLKNQTFTDQSTNGSIKSFSRSENVKASNTYETSTKVNFVAFSVVYTYAYPDPEPENTTFNSTVKMYVDNKIYKEETFTVTKGNIPVITFSVPKYE